MFKLHCPGVDNCLRHNFWPWSKKVENKVYRILKYNIDRFTPPSRLLKITLEEVQHKDSAKKAERALGHCAASLSDAVHDQLSGAGCLQAHLKLTLSWSISGDSKDMEQQKVPCAKIEGSKCYTWRLDPLQYLHFARVLWTMLPSTFCF